VDGLRQVVHESSEYRIVSATGAKILLAVDVAPVPDVEDGDFLLCVVDLVDDPIVPNPEAPALSAHEF